jgi:multidrug efflux pump subunit AcrA (membrane-fusion protein)
MRLQRLIRPTLFSLAAGVALLTAICAARGAATAAPEKNLVTATTEASKRTKLSFNSLGIVKQVAVKEGDAVKEGQLLMSQDADIEQAELERLKLEAESNARIDFYQADLDVKKKVEKRKTTAPEGTFNESEIEEAQADVIKGTRQIEVATLEHNGDKVKAKQQAIKVDRMNLTSKFDGFVERIEIWEGEVCDPSKPAIIVVKNDPQNVIIRQLKTAQVALLKVGQMLDVRLKGESDWKPAKIWYISPVADAAAGTQLVKLEMPNPENRATGLEVEVKLPDNVAQAGAAPERTAANR